MGATDHHDMTLAVKVALNPNTANQLFSHSDATMITENGQHVPNRRLPADCNEGYVAQELSTATSFPQPREPVTLFQLLETLQVQ